MITLKQLITNTPFTQEVKQQALQQADSLSPDQKMALEKLCWDTISQEYNNKINLIKEKAMTMSALGEKPFSEEEVKQQEEALFLELASKLESAQSEEELEEVRKRLAQETTTS